MQNDLLASLKRLSDAELISQVKTLVARERGATALLIAHLAELDTRDVLLREGYSSLFAYCREALGLSDHEALNRIEAARAARRFPVIIEMLSGGSVHLTAVRLLAPHLTAENHRNVLADARGKRTEEIRAMAAALAPQPAPRATARPLPAPSPGATLAQTVMNTSSGVVSQPAAPPASAPVRPVEEPTSQGTALPLAAAPYKRQVTIAGETIEKLRLAKEMLSHALPTGDDAEIVDRALTLLLIELARKKFAATDRPGKARGAKAGSRYVPAEVKRVVWLRDLGRCAYVGASGHRCTERGFVEFHHVRPHEVGGEATVENIQLRCGRHNRFEAKVYFSREEVSGVVREVGPAYGAVARAAQANSF